MALRTPVSFQDPFPPMPLPRWALLSTLRAPGQATNMAAGSSVVGPSAPPARSDARPLLVEGSDYDFTSYDFNRIRESQKA